jgi:hypothetical protein
MQKEGITWEKINDGRFEAIIAMQQHSKNVSTTTDNGATIEEVVFSMWSATEVWLLHDACRCAYVRGRRIMLLRS